jgi:PAS domain S-box-containing protein
MVALAPGRFIAKDVPVRQEPAAKSADEREGRAGGGAVGEGQVRDILDAVPVLISYIGSDYRYRMVNRSYERWFGHASTELQGKHAREVLGEDAWEIVRPYLARALAGEVVTYDQDLPYRDGGPRSVYVSYVPDRDEQGRVRGLVAMVSDISSRKAAERATREAREELQLVVDTMPIYLARCSTERRFLLVNKAYAARLGRTPDQLLGKTIREVLGDAAYASIAPYIDVVLTGKPVNFETDVPYEGIGRRYMHVQYAPTFDAAGETDGWVAVTSDITRRRQLEEELKGASRRKDEFLAMLAHELRNPLAPVLNAVELMRRGGASDPTVTAEVIARQVHHMKHLLDDLLDVARVSQGKIQLRKEPLDLGSVLAQAVEISRPLIDAKRQRLATAIAERALPVEGDPTRLTQIFANLLNNAAKYTDEGGQIRLEASAEGGLALVRVRDDGVGMSPELIAHAFDLFTQADRSLDRAQGGLGIGLTMVKSLVQMHGGSVEASSEGQGRGSEFIVKLPLSSAWREAPVAAPASAEAIRALRALVVDDNVDAAESLSLVLEMFGHEVTMAHDGPSALEMALATRPDLVLLDIGLPGMDGYEVAERLRQSGLERTVLVALTGYGREEDMARSREAGFDHHLVKPVDVATLQKVLARVPSDQPRSSGTRQS